MAGYAPSILNFRKELLIELSKKFNVYACAPAFTPEIKAKLEQINVTCLDIQLNTENINPLNNVKYLQALYRQFKKIKPDYVLSYTIKPVIWGSFAAKLAGIKSISSMITGLGYSFSELDSFKYKLVNKIVSSLYRHALRSNKIVFFQNTDDQSLFIKKKILNKTPSLIINGSGVNLEHFSFSDQFPPKITFLMISRLLKDKGVYEFVAAAKQIKAAYQNVEFHLAGWIDGNPSCITQQELDTWEKEGAINFLGRLDDVRDSIKNASVFVLPTYYREGTPRSILEAMSMGRPIITTDAPGCKETVNHGISGYVVPRKNVTELVSCMKKFIEDQESITRFGKESHAIAMEKYDVHKVNHAIISALNL